MAGNKVGIILAVDGEREFRDAMTNAANAAKQVKAELQALEGTYSGNANSLEALTKKQELLEKQQGKVKAALEQAKAGYDNAQKAVEKHRAALDSSNREVDEAQKELEQLKRAYGEASDEVKEQERKLSELTNTQEANQRNLATAESCTQKWAKKVSSASKDVQKNSKALEKNEKYLDEARESTDQCATSIDEYGDQVRKATKETEGWSDSLKTGVAVAAAGFAKDALRAVVDKAKEAAEYVVDVGSSFEAGMSKVQAISGASGSSLEALTAKAKQLGASTKFSASEAADAFSYMAMAGWDTQDMLDGIDGILNLAAASGEDLATTSDIVTDALTAMGYSAGDASHLADVMAAASANANTNVGLMGSTFQYAAPIVGALGYSMEDTAVAIGLMANAGIKGDKAGTALRAMLTRLSAPPKECAAEMERLGISLTDSEGNMKSLDAVMGDLRTAFAGMSESEQTAAAKHIAGANAMSGLLAIVNAAPSDFDKLTKAVKDSDGAAANMATTVQDNLQGDLTTLDSTLEGLGIAAFGYVQGPLRSTVQTVTGFISGITDAITPQKTALETFIEDINKSNESVKTSLGNAEKVLAGYESDSIKLDAYATALKEVAGATETTEFQKYQISKIVEELADEIPELSEAWDEEAGVLHLTADEVDRLMKAYSNSAKQEAYIKAMKAASDALIESEINVAKADSAVKKAQEELNAAREEGAEYADYHARVSKDQSDEQGRLVNNLDAATAAQAEANRLQQEARDEYELTAQTLAGLGAEIDENGNVIVSSMDGATESAEGLAEAVNEIDPEQLETLEKAAEDMRTGIEGSMQGAVSVFDDFEAKSTDSLDTIITRLEKQKEAIDGWAKNMETLATQVGEGMSQEFYDYLAQLGPEQGAALVQQLVDSMQAGDGEFAEVSKAWTEAMDVSADAEKITGATQAGKDLADAYSQGITENTSQAGEAADTLREEAVQRLGSGTEPAREHGKELAESYNKGVEEGMQETGTDQYGSAGAGALMHADSSFRDAGESNIKAYAEGQASASYYVEEGADDISQSGLESMAAAESGYEQAGAAGGEAYGQGLGQSAETAAQSTFAGISQYAFQADYEAAGEKAGNDYGSGLNNSGMKETVEATMNEAIETVNEKAEEYKAASEEAAASMSEGMESAQEEVATGAETAADAGVTAIQNKDRDFTDAGTGNTESYAGGVEAGTATVETKAKAVAFAGMGALRDPTGYAAAGGENASSAASGMEGKTSEVTGSAGGLAYSGISAILAQQGGYYSAGQDLASGTGGGISSMASYVMEKARQIVRDALAAAKNEAGIHSPSKKWKKEVGEMLTKGMAEGIQAGKADAVNAAQIVTDAVYDKATAWLAKKKKKQDISVKSEQDFWKRVEKAAKDGVEAYKKQVAQVKAAAKDMEKAENATLAAKISSHFGVSKTTTSGSGSNKKTVKKDAEKYYSEIFSAAKKYLDNYETIHDLSLQQELTYWKKLQKTLKKGTQAWYDAQKQINSVNNQIKTAKSKTQSESLSAEEAYVKKRTYMGKMDTEAELAYWKQQIKGFKKYSDEWYTVTDRIKTLEQTLSSEKTARQEEEARKRSELLSGMEKEVDRKRTLESKDAAWELVYWKERIKNFSADTDEYLTVYKKIRALEEEAAANRPDPVEEARQQRQSLASVQNSILSKYKTYYKVSLKAEVQYWDAARKQFVEGTDERIEADQKYFDAAREYTEQREQLEKDYLAEQQSIMDEEKASIEELTKAYTDAVDQREKAILQSFGLFDAWDNEGYTSEAMLRNARTQIEGLKLWEQEITELRKKNLPQSLMDQLEEMGPEATANIYTLNRMTADELGEWVRIWQEKQNIARRQAETQSKGELAETAKGIASEQAEAQKKLADLKKQYDSDLAEMNAGISSSLAGMVGKAKTIGEDTVASLISGLKTKMDESLPGMEAYYSDWERKWMNGVSQLNAVTGAGAGSAFTQAVTVDTGNIAGILVAILASLNDVKDGVGSGATITMDQLTARISTNMAASTYRSTRGGIV